MNKMIHGDCLNVLPEIQEQSVNCCVTSPPYWGLRDYGADGQLGLEATPDEYVAKMVALFAEVRRVLRDDGTLWLNLGDSYCAQPAGNKTPCGFSQTRPSRKKQGVGTETVDLPKKDFNGLKPKDLIGIPWRVAFALQADGWYLRQDIIWHKPNPMPESVKDRCTKAHEYIFLLSKNKKYYFDNKAIKEPGQLRQKCNGSRTRSNARKVSAEQTGRTDGATKCPENSGRDGTRNKRSVWTVSTKPFKGAHFATFPPDLIEPCILAGCPEGGVVLDPFMGAGTTAYVSKKLGRNYLGVELNKEYIDLANKRLEQNLLAI